MEEINKLKKQYESSYQEMIKIIDSKNYEEKDIIKIISSLSQEDKTFIVVNDKYNLESISSLLRFYEDELKNSFTDDNEKFHVLFKIYLLILELFTTLCNLFSFDKEKRTLIEPTFQLLKESKNILKFFIPFRDEEIRILNNIIGEELYYFSHINYINLKDKTLDYILEEYLLNCERMHHGIELSISSNFGDNPYKNEETELMILKNNMTFLLLKMIHKLKFFIPKEEYTKNNYFFKIIEFIKEVSIIEKDLLITSKESLEKALISEFRYSAESLKKEKNYKIIDEKLKLLALNTDEYKELIDIISSSRQ